MSMVKIYLIVILFLFEIPSVTAQRPAWESVIDSIVERFMTDDKVPGLAVAVLQSGEPKYVQVYGKSNLELNTAVTNKTVFELASVTKQMSSALILTLVEEGKMRLEDHISKYISNIPEGWKDITLHQLLGHMGGLSHRFEPMVNGSYLLNYSKDYMLEGAKNTPMKSVPGTDWEYSDQGYFLAGYMAEVATGMSFDSLMQVKFFLPMGMKNTRFLNQDDIIPNRAAGYLVKNGAYKNNRRQWQFELTPHFGVMSTIDDMVKYEQGIQRGVISKKAFEMVTTPYRIFFKNGGHQYSYGLGWEVHDFGERRIVTHSGYTGTVYLRDLQTGLSIILLTNRDENQGTSQHVLARRLARVLDKSFPEF
jgi:CubicO group peptidase (beta-lactamase class C family)